LLQPISPGDDAGSAPNIPACVLRVDRGGIGVEWRDMACPAVIAIVTHAIQRVSVQASENHHSAGG
jgi:hypothetical protein